MTAPHSPEFIKQRVAEHWNARAPMLDASLHHIARSEAEDRAWHELLARHLPAGDNLRVLDIGTGLGYLASVAARLGHDATGIDIADAMIARARDYCASLGVHPDLRVADADNLPFEDASFDAITERNVLWTMPEPGRTLAEFRRVLRPGGHLLVFESKWLESKSDPVETAAGGAPNLDVHYREFRAEMPLMGGATPAEIVALLARNGFGESVVDHLDDIWQIRIDAHPEMDDTGDKRLYLVRATREQAAP